MHRRPDQTQLYIARSRKKKRLAPNEILYFFVLVKQPVLFDGKRLCSCSPWDAVSLAMLACKLRCSCGIEAERGGKQEILYIERISDTYGVCTWV